MSIALPSHWCPLPVPGTKQSTLPTVSNPLSRWACLILQTGNTACQGQTASAWQSQSLNLCPSAHWLLLLHLGSVCKSYMIEISLQAFLRTILIWHILENIINLARIVSQSPLPGKNTVAEIQELYNASRGRERLGQGKPTTFSERHTLGKSLLYVIVAHVLKAIIFILSIVLMTFIAPRRKGNWR